MIDEKIGKLALEMSQFWTSLLRNHPRYSFDFSWPSVGSLNLVLSHLFDSRTLSETDDDLIRRASAYLAIISISAWASLGEDIETEATLVEGNTFEIKLTASGKIFGGKREKLVIPLYSALREVVTNSEVALRVFENFEANELWLKHRINLFALSTITGLCSFAEGKWAKTPYEEAKVHLGPLSQHLASTTAKYYELLHPEEPFGADPKKFLGRLLPPGGFAEDFLFGRAAFAFAHMLQESKLESEKACEIAMNFALFPEAQLAYPAFAVALALSLEEPSEKMIALSDGFGPERTALKPAMTLARQALQRPTAFTNLGDSQLSAEAELILQGEKRLGLVPHLRVDLEYLLPVPHLPQLLYWGLTKQARATIDTYFESSTRTAALILQGVYLDFVSGDLERANAELQNDSDNSALRKLPDGPLLSLRNELIATLAAHRGDTSLAVSMYSRAARASGLPMSHRSSLLSVLGQAHAVLDEEEEAIRCFEESSSSHPCFAAEFARLTILRSMRPEETFEDEVQALLRISPRNEAAFRMLVSDKLRTLT